MKDLVRYVSTHHSYSERRACQLTRLHRSTQRKPSTRDLRTEIRQRMHAIAQTRIRYGYRRIHVMLRQEGWQIGRNLVYRLYREEGLVLRANSRTDARCWRVAGGVASSDRSTRPGAWTSLPINLALARNSVR